MNSKDGAVLLQDQSVKH